ncbi:MAG: impB/mucB/samB family protein [Alphaproteobacteria bacterium]|nr:impB/mucB/samB family protein [Alphaproteobacteria bacterium]USO07432.1 MAG: impB/mucB/samB family protein [Rhodospirillales bacterium]
MFSPPPDTGVSWLLLDLNSYFASVEQQLNPALRGRPVVVAPTMTDYTCAIAASYEAKAMGIKTGTQIAEARRLCPDLACVPARHDVYVEFHHKVVNEMARHTPIDKIWSIDEMNSRLTPRHRTRAAVTALAMRIKAGLRENVGVCIRASIGVATNAFLAKTASDMQKPDGLVILEGRDLPARLLPLGIGDLCGIGPNMRARLNRAGIWTMADLWASAPRQLRGIWGSVEGEKFWYRLHGYDVPDLPEGPKRVIGHSRVLDPDSRRPDIAMAVCRRLSVKACQRLRRHGLYATHFALSARLADGRRWSGEARLAPACDTLVFVRLTHALWAQMIAALRPDMTTGAVKKVSISLSGLQTGAETTGDLFAAASPQAPHRRVAQLRANALSAAMDKIARAYGPHAVHFGIQPHTQAGYVGTKIAFSRVPDLAEFME